MPVLVTGAHRHVPRVLALRLLTEGGEVRGYGHGDTAVLRSSGAFIASGTPDDEGRLEAAMAEVHTVVHVGRGLLGTDPAADLAEARVLVTAATNAGVRRLIVLSIAGADPAADDDLRRTKGQVEQIVADAAPPSIVVRTSLVDTPAVRDALATAGLPQRTWDVEVAPVALADVADLVVAFDRARSRAEEGHLLVAADGPTRLELGDWLDRVGVGRPGRGSLLGRKMTEQHRVPQLADALLAGPWTSEGTTALDGWAFAGLHPTPPPVGG